MIFYGGLFDVDNKLLTIKKLEEEMNSSNFWDDNDKAKSVIDNLNELKDLTDNIVTLRQDINDNLELLGLINLEQDQNILDSIEIFASSISDKVAKLELELLLNGEYDHNNAIVEIILELEVRKPVIGLICFTECILDGVIVIIIK